MLALAATGPAHADPCVQGCRGQHNACRMATKLLMAPACDAQLQNCMVGCFAAARGGRDRDFRGDRGGFPHDRGFPGDRDFRGGREFPGGRDMLPGGPRDDRGGFRDRR
jgi:hypothetical protein